MSGRLAMIRAVQRTSLDFMSVVEHHPDKAAIDAELRKLDDRLFLDPEQDPDFGRVVWTVKYHLGAGQEPMLISDWRDPHTRVPLDLSWSLWSRIKAREHREPFKLRDEIKAENAKLRELRSERTSEAYEEIARDVQKFASPLRSGLLPRGQGLRRARDRQRAAGLIR